jgi:hypothetical protein
MFRYSLYGLSINIMPDCEQFDKFLTKCNFKTNKKRTTS